MTRFEAIKQMDKGTLVKWIMKIMKSGESFADTMYCGIICEYGTGLGKCTLSDDMDDLPCGNNSAEMELLAWLDAEV